MNEGSVSEPNGDNVRKQVSGFRQRVAMIGPFALYPKGTVQVRMMPLARRLCKLGMTVTIILPPYDNRAFSGKELLDKGIKIKNVRLIGGPGFASDVLASFALVRETLRSKPNILHVFKPRGHSGVAAMIFIIMRKARLVRFPILVDTDDWEGYSGFAGFFQKQRRYPKLTLWFMNMQETWIVRRSAFLTSASKVLSTRLVSLGVPPSNILYIPNGPSDNIRPVNRNQVLQIRNDLGLEGTTSVLLYTRFFEYDSTRLARVLSLFKLKYPDFRLLVVGKGENYEETEFMNVMTQFGLSKNIIYVGWVAPTRLPEYLLAPSTAVYPLDNNTINTAKCPGKLVELLSLGVPTVAEGVGQVKEYIQDSRSGFAVPSGDVTRFANRLIELAGDSELQKRFAAQAQMRIKSHFNWDLPTDRLFQVYSHLSHRNPQP